MLLVYFLLALSGSMCVWKSCLYDLIAIMLSLSSFNHGLNNSLSQNIHSKKKQNGPK